MNYVKIFSAEHVSIKNQQSFKFYETDSQKSTASGGAMSNFPLHEGIVKMIRSFACDHKNPMGELLENTSVKMSTLRFLTCKIHFPVI